MFEKHFVSPLRQPLLVAENAVVLDRAVCGVIHQIEFPPARVAHVQRKVQPLLALPQRRLGPLPFGDVADHAHQVVPLILDKGEGDLDGENRPVLPAMDAFKSQRPRLPGRSHMLREGGGLDGGIDLPDGLGQHLRAGIAQVEAALLVDVQEASGLRIDHLDGVFHALDQRAEEPERCLRLPALGDVAGDAEQGGDAARRIAQRAGVRLHPAPGAFEGGDLIFEAARLAAHHALRQGAEGRAVFLGDERIDVLVLYLGERIGLHHPQARGIHVQQRAVGSQQLHALRLGIEDGAQPRLALGQGAVGRLQFQAPFLGLLRGLRAGFATVHKIRRRSSRGCAPETSARDAQSSLADSASATAGACRGYAGATLA